MENDIEILRKIMERQDRRDARIVLTWALSVIIAIVIGLVIVEACEAQTCPDRLQLQPRPATSRTGKIIYKSNWNVKENRESTVEEGNHSQKGAALLVDYKYAKYLPTGSRIEVRSSTCKLVSYFGRYPRCTSTGCGTWERWYSRAPGGGYLSVASLAAKLGTNTALIRLNGRKWAVVQNVFSDRETDK